MPLGQVVAVCADVRPRSDRLATGASAYGHYALGRRINGWVDPRHGAPGTAEDPTLAQGCACVELLFRRARSVTLAICEWFLEALVMATPALHPEYITDADGRRKAVVLPIDEYESLVEDLADLALLAERRGEPTSSHQEVVDELRRDGLLPD